MAVTVPTPGVRPVRSGIRRRRRSRRSGDLWVSKYSAHRSLLEERDEHGVYLSLFDLVKRVNLRAVNKKCIESLVNAGAFEGFEKLHRAQYFQQLPSDGQSILEKILKQGNAYQQTLVSAQNSLFGESGIDDSSIPASIARAAYSFRILVVTKLCSDFNR